MTQGNCECAAIARAAAGQMVMTGSHGSRGQETAGLGPGLDTGPCSDGGDGSS